ncbi:MAG: ribonuclease [Candidatus Saccharibacteria bacterium]|nr:ribonuclease [Candidatus Saccharibacteria bacterium]
MINRVHRFHGYGSLARVYRRSSAARGSGVSVRFAARSAGQPARAAVVVSKKVSKSAVTRNRIRRRIYEAVRVQWQPAAPVDLIFTVFDGQLAELPTGQLHQEVANLLQKAGQTGIE